MNLEKRTRGQVLVIGGANVDIQGAVHKPLKMQDSNPGKIQTTLGGVGRNIAENCSLLGLDVQMITAIGKDSDGDFIRNNAVKRGIDLSMVLWSEQHRTSTYLYILDADGELCVAINDMEIVESIDVAYLKPLIASIDLAAYTVIDANLSKKSIEFLVANLKNTKIVFDTVSSVKALRVADVLDGVDVIKMNRHEAESLVGKALVDEKSISLAGDWLMKKGVKEVIISLGSQGVYYRNPSKEMFKKASKIDVKNATGAGDSFTAALVYGLMEEMDKEQLMVFCMGAASLTLMSPLTIAEEMSIEAINRLR